MLKRSLTAVTVGLMVLGLVVSTDALAGGARKVQLADGTKLNGTSVERGTYMLKWADNGSGVAVKLFRNGRLLASAKGQWVERDATAPTDGLAYRPHGDGTKSIAEIRVSGKSRVIVVETS